MNVWNFVEIVTTGANTFDAGVNTKIARTSYQECMIRMHHCSRPLESRPSEIYVPSCPGIRCMDYQRCMFSSMYQQQMHKQERCKIVKEVIFCVHD